MKYELIVSLQKWLQSRQFLKFNKLFIYFHILQIPHHFHFHLIDWAVLAKCTARRGAYFHAYFQLADTLNG